MKKTRFKYARIRWYAWEERSHILPSGTLVKIVQHEFNLMGSFRVSTGSTDFFIDKNNLEYLKDTRKIRDEFIVQQL